MHWEDLAVVSKWTCVSCWLTSSFPRHHPPLTPGDASSLFKIFLWPSTGFLSICSQYVCWKGEKRDQDEIRALFLKLHKTENPTLDFKVEDKLIKRASWSSFLNPQISHATKCSKCHAFPWFKIWFYKRKKTCFSIFDRKNRGLL